LWHCIWQVPYYRRAFPAAGVFPDALQSLDDFRRLPLLPRRTYQEDVASFVAEQLPPDTVATSTHETSGSSGTPTKVFHTDWVDRWWCAFYLRDLEWCNFDPTGTVAAVRSFGPRASRTPQLLEGVRLPSWGSHIDSLIET